MLCHSKLWTLVQTQDDHRAEYSEHTSKAIDNELGKLLAAAEKRMRETLAGMRPELEALARAVLEHALPIRAACE